MSEWQHLYVVYRVELAAIGGNAPEHAITIKEILPSEEAAEREVDRLNALNADKQCTYAFQAAKYYPQGR